MIKLITDDLITRSVRVQQRHQYLSYILRFFAPLGQLVALIGMKFGMTLWNINAPQRRIPVCDLYKIFSVCGQFLCGLFLNLGNLLKGFQSYGSLKLGCIFPRIFSAS